MNSVKFCCVEGMDSVLEVLAGSCLQCLRGVSFWEGLAVFWWGACNVLEGHGILEEVLAVVLEGVAFLDRGVWHFWRACSILEGTCSVAVFWRGVAFWRSHLQCLEECGIFGGR